MISSTIEEAVIRSLLKEQENELHMLEEGLMDSVYEFYNDLTIDFIKKFPNLGKNIKKYGSYLAYVPGPIGIAAAAAVFFTNVLEGNEEEAKASLALIASSLLGGRALAKAGMSIGGLARSIRNFLPPAVLSKLGGERALRVLIEKQALPLLNQIGANQAERLVANKLKAAETYIGDKEEFKKKITTFRMRTVPDPERKTKKVAESVIRRLLNEQPYKTPGQEYTALFLDQQSRDKLTDTLDDPPPGWALHADHMTVKFGSEGVPERYLGPAQLKVVGVALNDRVMAARVETDIPAQNDIPHITIATAPGAKPRESNDFSLDDFDDVDAIVLKGEVRPKFREELQKKRPGI